MSRQHAKRILTYLERRIAALDNSGASGRRLKGELGVFWRYRVGDYRLLCEIQDEALTILVALKAAPLRAAGMCFSFMPAKITSRAKTKMP